MLSSVAEAIEMKGELVNRGRLLVTTAEGTRFTIEHKTWEGCLNFFGIIPEGKAQVIDGHRLLNDDALIDWLTELKRIDKNAETGGFC